MTRRVAGGWFGSAAFGCQDRHCAPSMARNGCGRACFDIGSDRRASATAPANLFRVAASTANTAFAVASACLNSFSGGVLPATPRLASRLHSARCRSRVSVATLIGASNRVGRGDAVQVGHGPGRGAPRCAHHLRGQRHHVRRTPQQPGQGRPVRLWCRRDLHRLRRDPPRERAFPPGPEPLRATVGVGIVGAVGGRVAGWSGADCDSAPAGNKPARSTS